MILKKKNLTIKKVNFFKNIEILLGYSLFQHTRFYNPYTFAQNLLPPTTGLWAIFPPKSLWNNAPFGGDLLNNL